MESHGTFLDLNFKFMKVALTPAPAKLFPPKFVLKYDLCDPVPFY